MLIYSIYSFLKWLKNATRPSLEGRRSSRTIHFLPSKTYQWQRNIYSTDEKSSETILCWYKLEGSVWCYHMAVYTHSCLLSHEWIHCSSSLRYNQVLSVSIAFFSGPKTTFLYYKTPIYDLTVLLSCMNLYSHPCYDTTAWLFCKFTFNHG